MYGIVGGYYRHLVTPEGRRHMTPASYLAAATFVPICLAGVPLFMSLLSYFGTSALSRMLCWSLAHSDLRTPAGWCAPPFQASVAAAG